MKNIIKNKLIILVFSFALLSIPTLSYGQTLLIEASGENCDEGDATYCGNYEVNDIVKMMVNVSDIILGLVGSLSLLAFVIGGVMFMLSAGSKEKVQRAQQVIVSAVIGLVIVFSSWLIISFVITSLGANTVADDSLEIEVEATTPAGSNKY